MLKKHINHYEKLLPLLRTHEELNAKNTIRASNVFEANVFIGKLSEHCVFWQWKLQEFEAGAASLPTFLSVQESRAVKLGPKRAERRNRELDTRSSSWLRTLPKQYTVRGS